MTNMKICSKCKVAKSLDDFYNSKSTEDGKITWCKECWKEHQKECSQTEKGRKVRCEISKRHRQTEKGKETRNECNKRHSQTEKGKVTIKKYRQSEKGKVTTKRHRQSDKGREARKAWDHKQSAEHTQSYIRQLLSTCVRQALNSTKAGKTMSCEKYDICPKAIAKHIGPHPNTLGIKGKYHIDHRVPLSCFDLTISEYIKVAFDPLNHQWLSETENLKKGNKIPKQCDIPKALLKKLKSIGLKLY